MTARRYAPRRDAVIEAVQWNGKLSDLPTAWRELDMVVPDEDGTLIVRTLEGLSVARRGDYVVRGTGAEFYPVRKPIFEAKYEAVDLIEAGESLATA